MPVSKFRHGRQSDVVATGCQWLQCSASSAALQLAALRMHNPMSNNLLNLNELSVYTPMRQPSWHHIQLVRIQPSLEAAQPPATEASRARPTSLCLLSPRGTATVTNGSAQTVTCTTRPAGWAAHATAPNEPVQHNLKQRFWEATLSRALGPLQLCELRRRLQCAVDGHSQLSRRMPSGDDAHVSR